MVILGKNSLEDIKNDKGPLSSYSFPILHNGSYLGNSQTFKIGENGSVICLFVV